MTALALLAALFFAYALVARWLDRWSITAPMVFLLGGIALGRAGTAFLDVGVETETARVFVELTLALLLFTDAATVALAEAEGDARYDGRLLAIGLPLTIVVGAVAAGRALPRHRLAGRRGPRDDPRAHGCRPRPAARNQQARSPSGSGGFSSSRAA